ncbi:hypothetical protein L226DRAFT_498629 [Lentinus tigrinus ALCF2SS1-7]|uniref:Uncharacterized protein n=1 Tax=Lentinus tigrinus ALCF2SS1-6 TaxID=1328759 RepID=A0A5C2SV39_9APHY|nr:hypothetical protein L227DRAFT_559018 [Lentinus tigrinus ALCF2SS1-6]RPD80864.1 hypothetical protein L226DRAFT_498629 [Lentinus tigrinus ALCF2SS1-7]
MFRSVLTPSFVLPHPFLNALLALILSARLVAAALRTVIIDDTFGDPITGALPIYAPPELWTQGTPCTFDASECPLVNPDPSEVQNGTWHDSVGKTDDAPLRTVDLTFEGNSINVYCIISEVDRVEISVSNMTFELDGVLAGQFSKDVDGTIDPAGNYTIHYNTSVFSSGTIPQAKHTLRIGSVGYSRMLFDYAQYTTDSDIGNSTATASPHLPSGSGEASADTHASHDPQATAAGPNTPVIIGAVVAGVTVLVVLCVLGFVLLRRKRGSDRSGPAFRIDLLKHDKRFYGKDDVDTRSYVSSTESVALEARPAIPLFPYRDATTSSLSFSSTSRFREDLEHHPPVDLSPTDSVPLMDFPAPPSLADQSLPRIIVTGEETRLVGPDNSMARYARQKVAEREAELTRRMREMEAALAAKYGVQALPNTPVTLPASSGGSTTTPSRTESIRSTDNGSEAALRGQLQELRVEIARMRTVQHQMALELRDATGPPPEYQ